MLAEQPPLQTEPLYQCSYLFLLTSLSTWHLNAFHCSKKLGRLDIMARQCQGAYICFGVIIRCGIKCRFKGQILNRIPSFLLREFSDHRVQNDLLPMSEAATEHSGFIVLCRGHGAHLIVRRNQKVTNGTASLEKGRDC